MPCHSAAENGEQDFTILSRFRPLHFTAKPAPLDGRKAKVFAGPAPRPGLLQRAGGQKALSSGTWNSGLSEAREHMPRKPLDISRCPNTNPQGLPFFMNGNPCHTASGGSSRGGTPLDVWRGCLSNFGPNWPEVKQVSRGVPPLEIPSLVVWQRVAIHKERQPCGLVLGQRLLPFAGRAVSALWRRPGYGAGPAKAISTANVAEPVLP